MTGNEDPGPASRGRDEACDNGPSYAGAALGGKYAELRSGPMEHMASGPQGVVRGAWVRHRRPHNPETRRPTSPMC